MTRINEFVEIGVERFLTESSSLRPEGMLPKLAFFAATIEELTTELKPAVEKTLAKHSIPASRILVNVGDDKLTTNDDIREFNRLDTEVSEKQFILLVNKGREGWNCRPCSAWVSFANRSPASSSFRPRCAACARSARPSTRDTSSSRTTTSRSSTTSSSRTSASVRTNCRRSPATREGWKFASSSPWSRSSWHGCASSTRCATSCFHRARPWALTARTRRPGWSTLVEKYRLIETQQDGLNVADAARASTSRTFDLTPRRAGEACLFAHVARGRGLSLPESQPIRDRRPARLKVNFRSASTPYDF